MGDDLRQVGLGAPLGWSVRRRIRTLTWTSASTTSRTGPGGRGAAPTRPRARRPASFRPRHRDRRVGPMDQRWGLTAGGGPTRGLLYRDAVRSPPPSSGPSPVRRSATTSRDTLTVSTSTSTSDLPRGGLPLPRALRPGGSLQELKFAVLIYPPKLKRALIEKRLWETRFSLEIARKPAARGEVSYVSRCLFRGVACMRPTTRNDEQV